MLELQPFVDHPGQRLPIDLILTDRETPGEDLRTVTEMRLQGEAFVQLSTLYLTVHVAASIRQPCRRCLEPVMTSEEIEEEFEIPIRPGTRSIDLWPDVVRLILSSHDPNVLCKKDCRGLCPSCGMNLNQEPSHRCATNEESTHQTLKDLASWTNDS